MLGHVWLCARHIVGLAQIPKTFTVDNVSGMLGFSFQISDRGGNGPPPKGGDSRGGTPSLRGGNSA